MKSPVVKRLEIANPCDSCSMETEHFCQFPIRHPGGSHGSYFIRLFPRYFCSRIRSSIRWTFYCPSFVRFVPIVVRFCADPKMRWIYARRIVAMMAHAKSFWNRSKVYQPRSAVRPDVRETRHSWEDHSVTEIRFCSCPHPTRTQFKAMALGWSLLVHFIPEPFFKSGRKAFRHGRMLYRFAHSIVLPRWGYWPREASSLCHLTQ